MPISTIVGVNMKTDIEIFRIMLNLAGIIFSEGADVPNHPKEFTSISIDTKSGPKNIGYEGYNTTFIFDASGSLYENQTYG